MPFDIDPIRIEQAFLVGAILGFLVALLGLVGMLLGWWNPIGETLIAAGSITALVLTLGVGLANASRSQVESVHESALENGEVLGSVDEKLSSLEAMERKLRKLGPMDEKLNKLEPMDEKLESQTKLLDRQLEVLDKIETKLSTGGRARGRHLQTPHLVSGPDAQSAPCENR